MTMQRHSRQHLSLWFSISTVVLSHFCLLEMPQSNILLFFSSLGNPFLIANACYHVAEQPECEPGWSYYKGSCYYLGRDAKTWDEAKKTCYSMGKAYLVIITSAEENNFVWQLDPNADMWIGYSDKLKEGRWLWEVSSVKFGIRNWEGQPFTYTNWDRNQPDNRHNQDCALIWGYYNVPKWDDRQCRAKKFFVCEKGELLRRHICGKRNFRNVASLQCGHGASICRMLHKIRLKMF